METGEPAALIQGSRSNAPVPVPSLAANCDGISQDLLIGSEEGPDDRGSRFIPHGTLRSVISQTRVIRVLQSLWDPRMVGGSTLRQVASRISPEGDQQCHCSNPACTGSRIIFAALLLTRHELILPTFTKDVLNLCDAHLPLNNAGVISTDGIFEILSEKEKSVFVWWQNRMRSPFLQHFSSYKKQPPKFDDEVTLPWTFLEAIDQPARGNLSVVQKVVIDPKHHDLVCQPTSFLLSPSHQLNQ